jgi:hypothetical protein
VREDIRDIANVKDIDKFNKMLEALFYWRTKERKELDFIFRIKDKVLPIEAKLNAGQFNPSAINYFNSNYGSKEYSLVYLEGELKDQSFVYPWEV